MYPKIIDAQSPNIASRIYATKQVHNVLLVCLYVVYATLYANGYVSLGQNLKTLAASFTSKCLKKCLASRCEFGTAKKPLPPT